MALALGGCQSLFGGGSQMRTDLSQVDLGDYFAGRMEAGRQHLEASRPTLAVKAFRQASYDRRYAADAFNGMAVAYDRIGRPDLAREYFSRAMAAAPQDARFSRNLARLEARFASMPQDRVAEADVAIDASLADTAVELAPIAVSTPHVTFSGSGGSSLQPTSGNSVRIARAPATPAVVRAPEPVRVATSRRAVVNVERRIAERSHLQRVRRNAKARKGYPIRVVLADRKRDAEYPIRVRIRDLDD